MATKLYLERFADQLESNNEVIVSLESFVCLFVYEYIERPKNVVIYFVESADNSKLNSSSERLCINVSALPHVKLNRKAYEQELASNCSFPVILTDENVVVAGLCGVCRSLVKNANETHMHLLGFKTGCLLAPAEVSIWTKFCEVDIYATTKQILDWRVNSLCTTTATPLPSDLLRFESHMSQPIRMHNVYRTARELAQMKQKNDEVNSLIDELQNLLTKEESLEPKLKDEKNITKDSADVHSNNCKTKKKPLIVSGTPIEKLNLPHTYVEGMSISIADVILYPHFWIMKTALSRLANRPETLEQFLPLTFQWLQVIELENDNRLLKCLSFYDFQRNFELPLEIGDAQFVADNIENFSLYKKDPKRYKPKNRIFTKQNDIEASLKKVDQANVSPNDCPPDRKIQYNEFLNQWKFNWDTIPFEAQPEAVSVPPNRLTRKKDQLESMARNVAYVSKDGDRIVDFCSGTGHLGILLAYTLPKCQVILLESKEESITRAKQRVDQLQLTNVLFLQCNLDYFVGQFDVGVSLHACGVATDIVLQQCIDRRANFVSCPCCYGSCHEMPHIDYPRSQQFRDGGITNQDYMHLAHSADQAHVLSKGSENSMKCKQGSRCMDIVDTDRKLHAEEIGYSAILSRLYPENCTPKNRLIIGIYDLAEDITRK